MKSLAKLTVVATALLGLSACGSNSGPKSDDSGGPQKYVSGGTFTMAMPADPGALDPATAVDGSTNLLLSFVYDTLVHTDNNGKIVSGLAASWIVKDNSVTFTLHPNATCSDGSTVTAADVAKSVNHVVDPATKSPLVGVLVPADVRASAVGADKVTLTTAGPSPFLLQSTVAIFIVCGKGLAAGADLKRTPVGSGPYTLTDSEADDHYTLTARSGYSWGPGGSATSTPGVPAKVVLKVVTNESTSANLLLSGGIDSGTFSGVDRQRVANASGIHTSTLPAGNGEFYFNEAAQRVTSDLAVRKALSGALDIHTLGKVASQNTGTKSTGLTTLSPRPCRVDSVSGHQPSYSIDAAKQTLEDAGWTVRSGGVREKDGKKLSITLLYNTDDGAGVAAGVEYAEQQWKMIGVDTKLTAKSSAAYSDSLFSTGSWDVSWVPIGLSLPSQFIGYVSGEAPPDGSNFGQVHNTHYDRLVAKAAKTSLADGGCDIWAQAESALFDNYDVLPVIELNQLVASKNAEVVMPGGLAQPTLFRMLKG